MWFYLTVSAAVVLWLIRRKRRRDEKGFPTTRRGRC
jgi:hypothetical protein